MFSQQSGRMCYAVYRRSDTATTIPLQLDHPKCRYLANSMRVLGIAHVTAGGAVLMPTPKQIPMPAGEWRYFNNLFGKVGKEARLAKGFVSLIYYWLLKKTRGN